MAALVVAEAADGVAVGEEAKTGDQGSVGRGGGAQDGETGAWRRQIVEVLHAGSVGVEKGVAFVPPTVWMRGGIGIADDPSLVIVDGVRDRGTTELVAG